MSSTIAVILLIVVAIVALVSVFLLWYTRRLLRETKSYERGLKMVPLLIHLPPLSDDIQTQGRDARDIAEENISKAQVLYNIIASTAKKGFKSHLYGQRHISFEIVAHKGMIDFYAAVPIILIPVVEQAVLSAYPSSRIEEVEEHNIFSPVGKINGTTGGELVLKESFAYPIATYQDLKRDSMQSLLNSLATLDKEDGAGIQILLRPAYSGWNKEASSEASKRRQGKKDKKGPDLIIWWLQQLFMAAVRPPDAQDKEAKADKPSSSLDQSIADAIDEKTKYTGYEVLIRIMASSNISQRAQIIRDNIVASFSLFDAPGKNGFKFLPAKDIESFVTAYILRFFPPENRRNILNVVELSTIFHFPDATNIPTSQLEKQASKQVDGPRNLVDDGLLLGYNVYRGVKKPIRLTIKDRRQHMYVVGKTGTGKSVFLENIALQDMLEGRGFAFIDPHGDSVEKLLGMVPKERTEDVIYFNPADMDYPLGFNIFEYQTPEQKDFVIQECIGMLYKLYDPQHTGIVGPRYEHIFRNCALLLMSDPGGCTFIDIPKLLVDNNFAKQKLKYCTDQSVLDFWQKELPNSQRSNEAGEVTSWVVSKFGAFLSNEMMRNIIGQTKSAFNLREVMDEGKILLVNLSKGRTGELNSMLLGLVFVMKFQAAAMSRADVPEDQRQDYCLYVDEFQNFSTESFATILSESRKYRLNLAVANQFITQLSEEIRDSVFGNIGTIVAHRVGPADAEALEKQFRPVFDIDDLQRLPMANSITKTLIGGLPTEPFSMEDLPMIGQSNKQLATALKQLSAAKYGQPKTVVEAEIFKRLRAEEPPRPTFNMSPLGAGDQRADSLSVPGQSSFLDEWLAKKRLSNDTVSATETSQVKPESDKASNHKTHPTNAAKKDKKETDISDQQLGRNISSSSIDSQEVDSIADQLRQGLAKVNPSQAIETTSKNVPLEPEKIDDQRMTANPKGGVLQHNDTIYIDKEGNMLYKEPEK